MKRSITSINNNQDADLSQSKRTRSTTAMRQEKNKVDTTADYTDFSSQKKSSKKNSQHINDTSFNDELIRGDDYAITTFTPSTSSISFSSSSLSKDTPPPTNNNKKAQRNTNQSSHLQQLTNSSTVSRNRARSTNVKSTDDLDRTTARSNTQAKSSSSSTSKSQPTISKSSTRGSTGNNLSASHRSLSSHDSTNSTTNNFPMHSLVEGSLEYRELKRLYMNEKHQAEEWRKDYKVLKQQLAQVKSSTIPRPTAEVLEWLQELFDVMNNNGVFRGDGRTLQKIGEDLGLDATDLVTVAARTPQRSALKLFRLVYPTIGGRAECGSIRNVPEDILINIYQYVRTIHPNLSFSSNNMRVAIATSIRSAKSELRKLERYRVQQMNLLQNDENLDPDERDERIADAVRDLEAVLNATDAVPGDDNDEDDEDEDNEDDDEDKENEDEDKEDDDEDEDED